MRRLDFIAELGTASERNQKNAPRASIVVTNYDYDWLYPHAVARVVAALAPGVAPVQFRLRLVDGAGREIDLLPPPEVKFDDGDVVPILLRRGRYASTVDKWKCVARTAPPFPCASARP
jgi:hypothetical protein